MSREEYTFFYKSHNNEDPDSNNEQFSKLNPVPSSEQSNQAEGKRDFLQFNVDKGQDDDQDHYDDTKKKLKTESRDKQKQSLEIIKRSNSSPMPSHQEEDKLAPWMSKSTQKIKNTLVRFHNEMIDFANHVTPSKEDHSKREKSLAKLTQIVIGILPEAKVIPFGSFATHLYLPHGDIDLVIVEPKLGPNALMNTIAKSLLKNTDYDSINIIRSAKVPLIKLVEKSTNFNFDISFNKMDGVKQLKEIQKGLEYYPEMKHLLLVIKCFLRQRDLNETYTGGIGSFLLFCLILTFLREVKREYVEKNNEEEASKLLLSELLLRFLDFYANFDVSGKQIIVAEGGAIVEKYEKDNNLSVISPQDATHDVGGPSFKIKEVFGIFKNRYNFLNNYNFGERESILKYLIKAELL